MRICFPVVSATGSEEPVGYGEVAVGNELREWQRLHHGRFAMDNVLNAWSLLFPEEHWPEPVMWRPYTYQDDVSAVDQPSRWRGASANLATLLAMAHHRQPFQASWLNTDTIWATGLVSPEGGHTSLRRIDSIHQKVQAFVSFCTTHTSANRRAGVFIVPAVLHHTVQDVLNTMGAEDGQITFFDPEHPPKPDDTRWLILLVKINQVEPLIQCLRGTKEHRNQRISSPFAWVAWCLVVLAGCFGLWKSWNSWQVTPSASIARTKSSQASDRKTWASRSTRLLRATPRPNHVSPAQTNVTEVAPATRKLLPFQPRDLRVRVATTDIAPTRRKPRAWQRQTRKRRDPERSVKRRTKPRRKVPTMRRRRARHPRFYKVRIIPKGYTERFSVKMTKTNVPVQSISGVLLIPRQHKRLKLTIFHKKKRLDYESCTIVWTPKVQQLWLDPLLPEKEPVPSRDYCWRKKENKK